MITTATDIDSSYQLLSIFHHCSEVRYEAYIPAIVRRSTSETCYSTTFLYYSVTGIPAPGDGTVARLTQLETGLKPVRSQHKPDSHSEDVEKPPRRHISGIFRCRLPVGSANTSNCYILANIILSFVARCKPRRLGVVVRLRLEAKRELAYYAS